MAPFLIALGTTLLIGLSVIAILKRSTHKKEDRIAKDMALSPTFLWFNTAASLSIELNLDLIDTKQTFNYMLGLTDPYETSFNQGLRKAISQVWDIYDAQSAEKTMERLLKSGMRSQYKEEMEELLYKYGHLTEEELIALVPNSNEDSFLPKMITAYRRIGENAILGWDIGRVCYYAQACCLAGYISKEKMLKL